MRKLSNRLVLAALAALVAASPVFAGGPLANCQSGVPYLWDTTGPILWNPDQGDLGPLTNAQATAAVDQAFDVWEAIPTSTLAYAAGGFLPVDVDITNFGPYLSAPTPDGLSAIVYDDTGQIFDLLFGPGSGVLGFAGPEWGFIPTCTIIEGLSFLNGPAFTNATAALDVMVHEFGHFSNFAHTVVNGQAIGFGDSTGPTPNNTFGPPPPVAADVIETMYPFYFGTTSGTNTLHADDVAIASTMYPEPGYFAGTGTISGTIFAPNGTTRLTGVNVIARNVADPFFDAVSAISSDFTDSSSQLDPVVGTYTINGLTPGADYAVFVDQILAGGFSTPPASPLIGPEEFWNGADESNANPPDDPSVYVPITVVAGSPAAGTDIIFNQPGPGDPLPVGDDGNVQLALPFDFELCGETYSSVFVNANGNLTFGSGDFDFTESDAEMLRDQPRIAGLWDDLNPSTGGAVYFTQTPNEFTVHYENVPEWFSSGSNTFEITLKRSSNHIDIDYGAVSISDGLAGVSCGGAVTANLGTEEDLSASDPSRLNLHNQPARWESFSFSSPNDLEFSTVRFNGTTNYEDNWAESNDSFGRARKLQLPFTSDTIPKYTEIEPTGGDVDFYRFDAVAGTTLSVETVAGNLDTVVGLFDPAGNLLASDDDGGAGLLSKLIYPISADGEYAFAVSTFADFDFDGNGFSGGRYVVSADLVTGFILDLPDDGFQSVPLGFSFPFNGSTYTDVFVNSNGNLTFGSGDFDFTESVSEFLNEAPRIAPLWDDLSPNNGGQVSVEFGTGSATVNFENVPEFFATGANTFSVTLDSSGDYSIEYGAVSASDGLVGTTEGGGAADPGETDLSAGGPFNRAGTTYERFTGFSDPFDLDGALLLFNLP